MSCGRRWKPATENHKVTSSRQKRLEPKLAQNVVWWGITAFGCRFVHDSISISHIQLQFTTLVSFRRIEGEDSDRRANNDRFSVSFGKNDMYMRIHWVT